MNTLLLIRSSIHAEGASNGLADRYVELWRANHPRGVVIVRDLAIDPVPHLTDEAFRGFSLPEAERSVAQALATALSDELVDELRRADTVVFAVPMYNFGVPSTLKAWFDHVARAGVTFRYTETGPVGLLPGKRTVVLTARGGRYAGTANDTQSPWLSQILGFIGLDPVEFVHAEGLAYGAEARDQALHEAAMRIEAIAAPARLAA